MYDEIIVDQDSQILPAFFVTIQKTSISQPDITFDDTRFRSYLSTFEASSDQGTLTDSLIPGLTERETLLDSENGDFEMATFRPKYQRQGRQSSLFSDSEILWQWYFHCDIKRFRYLVQSYIVGAF